MNDFTSLLQSKVKACLIENNMLSSCKKIVVGFSGGADSVCLLHILSSLAEELNLNVKAVHINHGIRGAEAYRDADFCKSFCKNTNIDFSLVEVNCLEEARKSGESLETCARRLRYNALNTFCESGGLIATAHNSNDNAETVLFNLARGTALKGACGIPYKRENIIRPLLDCSRLEIESYCKENDICFVTDSTNNEDEYSRNKIRHNVIPKLSEINSSAVDNINRFSSVCSEITDFILYEAKKALNKASLGDNKYSADELKNFHKALLNECIVLSFSRFSNLTLDSRKIDEIREVILNGGRIQLFGSIYTENVKGVFRYFIYESSFSQQESLIVDSFDKTYGFNGFTIEMSNFTDNLKSVNKKFSQNLLDYDKIEGDLFIRTRKEGDSFEKKGGNGTKSLKKLFNEKNVPVELRNKLPILCDSKGIVWIYNAGVSKRCCVDETSTNIIFVKGENND